MKTTMKTALYVVVGVVGMLVAVAAQQPAAPTPTPDKVIEALKRPTAAEEPAASGASDGDASMAAVLARYNKMIAAGEAVPTTPTPTTARAARPAAATTSTPTQPVAEARSSLDAAAMTPATDTLDAIRADLQAIVGRLDALARKGGQ